MTEKYLFSIEVEPYDPNRQLSIINSNGGEPRYHFPTQGTKGLLVAKICFEDIDKLQQDQDWVERIHKGYYPVLNKFQG